MTPAITKLPGLGCNSRGQKRGSLASLPSAVPLTTQEVRISRISHPPLRLRGVM